MAIGCSDVRNFLTPSGGSPPLSDERAEEVADHVDQCAECDRELRRRIGEVVDDLAVDGRPSLAEVRRIARRQQSFVLRAAAAAAAILALLGTGWALLRDQPRNLAQLPPPPVEEPIPELVRFAELPESDRRLIQSESVLSLYLQFCLSCINNPTEEDKNEFLIRSLLIFREVRGTLKIRYAATPIPEVETVTREALSTAVQTLRSSPLPSVKLLPSRINGFRFTPAGEWQVDHLLGSTPFRFTLAQLPHSLNFTYLKKALGADDALMSRIEDVLWSGEYVNLPKKIYEKDQTVLPRVKEAVLPLLSPRQQKIYRKLMETP
jgi:hypothetical protein